MRKSTLVPFLLLALSTPAAATSYLIAPDGTGDFPTIQDALTASASGDSVLLADGTFSGAGNRNLQFGGKSLTILSQSGTPVTCTIDCEFAARGFTLVSIPASARIAGITITHGVGDGAGIYCENSFLTIENCVFDDNGVLDRGGGVHCRSNAHPVIKRCTFTNNDAVSGGGLYCYSAGADVFDSVFLGNVAHSVGGGGVWMSVTASVSLTGCTVQSNTAAQQGGGIWCGGSVVTPSTLSLTDCDVSGNDAAQLGGGLFCNSSFLTFTNTLIAGNHAVATDGGGAYVASSFPSFTGVTFAGNRTGGTGGAVYLYSADATFDHSILWGNCADTQYDVVSMGGSGSSATFLCSDASPAEVGGTGTSSFDADCLDADPLFCGPADCLDAPTALGDYTLDSISPAGPANVPCGRMGALDVACITEVAAPVPAALPVTSRAAPNPLVDGTRISFTAPAGDVRVTVLDVAGRVRRAWTESHGAPGDGVVTWDGRDARGRPVPAGTYFYRLRVGASVSTGKLVRLR